MSKKANKVTKKAEVIQMPVQDQAIDTSIDMKLSKQDLIDIVIEETREKLEAASATARAESDAARENTQKVHNECKKALVAKVKEVYKDDLAYAAKKGLSLDVDLSEVDEDDADEYEQFVDSMRFTCQNSLYATSGGILDYKKIRNNYNNAEKISLFDTVGLASDSKKKVQTGVYIQMTFTLAPKEVRKVYAPLVAAIKAEAEKQKAYREAQTQLNSVDKMGKKAKTQLIKRILESSTDGQAILSNMGSIKENVGQLLIESAKAQ